MNVECTLDFTKTQLKMFDCWYACVLMIKSSVTGSRVTSAGPAAAAHRAPITGRRINYGAGPGLEVMRENGLRDVSSQIRLNDINTLAKCMQTNGAVIACGKFALFNTQGHCIVVYGCNTDNGQVKIYDPGWGQGAQTKTYAYITQHVNKITGSDSDPAACSFVADDPNPFFDQATRGRR